MPDIIEYGDNQIQTDHIDSDWRKAWVLWLSELRPNSQRNHTTAWRQFNAFMHERTGQMIHPAYVNREHVQAWRLTLDKRLAPATVNLKLAGLSSYYKYVIDHYPHLCDSNPAENIKRHRVSGYNKATYMKGSEPNKLLAAIDTSTLKGKRDYAIIRLLLALGVRASAPANAKVGDIIRKVDRVHFEYVNKGGAVETKRLPPNAWEAIQDYLEARGYPGDSEPLFAFEGDTLQRIQITRMVVKYADIAFGPGHGLTAHSLRHTGAVALMDNGATLREIQHFLKHRNTRVTDIYTTHIMQDDTSADLADMLDAQYGEGE